MFAGPPLGRTLRRPREKHREHIADRRTRFKRAVREVPMRTDSDSQVAEEEVDDRRRDDSGVGKRECVPYSDRTNKMQNNEIRNVPPRQWIAGFAVHLIRLP